MVARESDRAKRADCGVIPGNSAKIAARARPCEGGAGTRSTAARAAQIHQCLCCTMHHVRKLAVIKWAREGIEHGEGSDQASCELPLLLLLLLPPLAAAAAARSRCSEALAAAACCRRLLPPLAWSHTTRPKGGGVYQRNNSESTGRVRLR